MLLLLLLLLKCRVMVPAQQLWVTGLSRATGCCSYGISTSPLLVHMPEQQVNSASLGAVVHVIGHAIQNVPNAHGTACTIQVRLLLRWDGSLTGKAGTHTESHYPQWVVNVLQGSHRQQAATVNTAAAHGLNYTTECRLGVLHCECIKGAHPKLCPCDAFNWVLGHCMLQLCGVAFQLALHLQVHANNVQPVVPHMLWALPPASTPSITSRHQQQPLHTLWELLGTALGLPQQGTQPALDPHLALTLLLSAAAVGGKARQQDPGAADQVG